MALLSIFSRHTDAAKPADSDAQRTAAAAESKSAPETESEKTTTDRETSVAVNDVDSLASVPSLSQLAAGMGLLDTKDLRAYEVARQRTKRTADREKAREQKIKARTAVATAGDARRRERTVKTPLDVEESRSPRKGTESGETVSQRKETGAGVQVPPRAHEIKFEDLLRIAKVSKEKAGDFEFVPHVRSVVVLDDKVFDVPDVDEAWEHVSSDEDDKKCPSYAQVVAASAK